MNPIIYRGNQKSESEYLNFTQTSTTGEFKVYFQIYLHYLF